MNDLQQKILDIFREVSSLCDAKGIPYYAIGGTALGAVRHKGFIPWDDDLDIAIPIEQYDRFITVAKRELPSRLEVVTPDDIEHYPSFFIKVADRETAFIEKFVLEFPEAYRGVFIDIMPLAGVPAPGRERSRYLRKWDWMARLNYIRRFPAHCLDTRLRKGLRRVTEPFYANLPYNWFTRRMFAEYRRHPLGLSAQTGYVWSSRLPKFIYDVEIFGDGVLLPFEDTEIRCPSQTDRYLTLQFGDYMELPPEEKRVGVHPAIVDLEHSYTEYQSGERKENGHRLYDGSL